MIPGWTTHPVHTPLLDVPLPVPHHAYYRDRTPIAVSVPGAGRAIVRRVDENGVAVRAGLNTEGEAAVEVEIVKSQVFHGILVDAITLDFGWNPCGFPLDTAWEQC